MKLLEMSPHNRLFSILNRHRTNQLNKIAIEIDNTKKMVSNSLATLF